MSNTSTTAGYTPGVCNINPTEIAYRRKAGYMGLAIAVIVAVPLFALGLNRWLRLLIALPVFLSALGFLQAKHRFCVAYAASGMQNASGSSMDGAKKVSATDRAKDKLKSNKIYLQGAAIAVVVAAIAVAIP